MYNQHIKKYDYNRGVPYDQLKTNYKHMKTLQSKQKENTRYQAIVSFIILTELTILCLLIRIDTQSFPDIGHSVLKIRKIHNLSCTPEKRPDKKTLLLQQIMQASKGF